MLNPFIAEIDGDLSRADAVVLVQACRGKEVVEYGVGASTYLLSQCARSLISFETETEWIDRVQEQLNEIDYKTCTPKIVQIPRTPHELPKHPCDVLFNDGHSPLREEFLKQYWPDFVRDPIILHDARCPTGTNLIRNLMDWYTPRAEGDVWPHNRYVACLERIDWCPQESNMIVLRRRNAELRYENWNLTEKDAR